MAESDFSTQRDGMVLAAAAEVITYTTLTTDDALRVASVIIDEFLKFATVSSSADIREVARFLRLNGLTVSSILRVGIALMRDFFRDPVASVGSDIALPLAFRDYLLRLSLVLYTLEAGGPIDGLYDSSDLDTSGSTLRDLRSELELMELDADSSIETSLRIEYLVEQARFYQSVLDEQQHELTRYQQQIERLAARTSAGVKERRVLESDAASSWTNVYYSWNQKLGFAPDAIGLPAEALSSPRAVARIDLGDNSVALPNMAYTVQAGIAPGDLPAFISDSIEIPDIYKSETVEINIALVAIENVVVVSEWHRSLEYLSTNDTPQLVDFAVKTQEEGSCSLAVDFSYQQRWLRTIKLNFNCAMKNAAFTSSSQAS